MVFVADVGRRAADSRRNICLPTLTRGNPLFKESSRKKKEFMSSNFLYDQNPNRLLYF